MTICNLDGVRQEFMENECEALPGIAYPGVRDNRSTLNTKTGYDDDSLVSTFQQVYAIICETVDLVNVATAGMNMKITRGQ